MPLLAEPRAVLTASEWRELEAAHHSRADALTAAHRARASRGERHPVEDFLFSYYSYKPAILRRWHAGENIELEDATERAGWRWYGPGAASHSFAVDGASFRAERALLVTGVTRILRATAGRAAGFGCFGLHEWAMVYRQGERRHPEPLRLGAQATDDVVEAHDLRCTHFDAFRFFTPDAAPRNRAQPTRDTQAALEQPGCLHAGMDLYKWAVKLTPLLPGDLVLDAFDLARDIRTLDMRASPYDLTAWGYEPVPVETTEGKATYVRNQKAFAERGQTLRARMLALLDRD